LEKFQIIHVADFLSRIVDHFTKKARIGKDEGGSSTGHLIVEELFVERRTRP